MAAAGPSHANQSQPAYRGNVRTMVAQVAAKIALSDETVATVVERTGGVPLFVEELTRACSKVAIRSSASARSR